jgi:SNF2 family DNA or RNA helicase
MSVDFSLARREPYAHQKVGVEALVRWDDPDIGRTEGGCFALFDEMGAGKTKQVIDAACWLFLEGEIDNVLVVAPAAVVSVWYHHELGQLEDHLWDSIYARISRFRNRTRSWTRGRRPGAKRMEWMIANYEFIRSKNRLEQLLPFCSRRTLLVGDESSAVKNHKAHQTKAMLTLRNHCGRVVLLNGTPISNSPGDMYAQGRIMSKRILDVKDYWQFRGRYARLGGWQGKKIVAWHDVEDIQRRFAPYVLRRLKSECLDLPEKMPPVTFLVPFNPPTWDIYKEMRDEMVAWLSSSEVSTANQAIVKAMRLSQICAGFLGGMKDPGIDLEMEIDPDRPSYLPFETSYRPKDESTTPEWKKLPPQEVGREKLDFFLQWLTDRLDEDPGKKILVWCRFRPELERLMKELKTFGRDLHLGAIYGSQSEKDREYALFLLNPRSAPRGPVVVAGTPGTGSMGLNLTASHTVIYLSNDYSLKNRLQSEDRVHRPGQRNVVSYYDIIATGPKGQKTIDHVILKALRKKESLANFTTEAWVSALSDEIEDDSQEE